MRNLKAISISMIFYLTYLLSPQLPALASQSADQLGGVDPFTDRAQCVARCCPWIPGVEPEKYKACLVRYDELCGRDSGLCKDGPPKPAAL